MEKLTHADKFAAQCRESNLAQERRQLIDAYGNDKASLKIALRELAYSKKP